ncbi:helix-turn-helix transcriptional regulator [Glutamicibacter uratoxydans]|nr:helix-turn-helix transcriptional regulator [Glutamicibacter uratoxydans]
MQKDVYGLADEIKRIRTDAKLRQVDMAERMGVSYRTYSRWETGVTTPPDGIIKRLKAAVSGEAPTIKRNDLHDAHGVDLGMEVMERLRRYEELKYENKQLLKKVDAYVRKYGDL